MVVFVLERGGSGSRSTPLYYVVVPIVVAAIVAVAFLFLGAHGREEEEKNWLRVPDGDQTERLALFFPFQISGGYEADSLPAADSLEHWASRPRREDRL